MAHNPKYVALLDEMRRLHDRKNSDYAHGGNPYSNFEFAATVAQDFTDPLDRVFATMIGIKLARICELTKPGRTPQNEALADTFIDLANYAAIWASYRRGDPPETSVAFSMSNVRFFDPAAPDKVLDAIVKGGVR